MRYVKFENQVGTQDLIKRRLEQCYCIIMHHLLPFSVMNLLDLFTNCKKLIVEKTFAQDSASLNLCSLFDRERDDINLGGPTLNCSVTSIDEAAMPPNKKSKRKALTNKGKGTEKGGDKGKKPKEKERGTGDGGGGKRASSPAKSVTSTNTNDTEDETSDEDEEVHDNRKKDVEESEEECEDDDKSVESREKTIAELCADGFDWCADERVMVCTDELKDPGSLLKALSVTDAPINRIVKQRIEDLEEAEMKLEIANKENIRH